MAVSYILRTESLYISHGPAANPGKTTGHDHSEPGSHIQHALAISGGHGAVMEGFVLSQLD